VITGPVEPGTRSDEEEPLYPRADLAGVAPGRRRHGRRRDLYYNAWMACRGSLRVCETFNGLLRRECLPMHLFVDLAEAPQVLTAWQEDYTTTDPTAAYGTRLRRRGPSTHDRSTPESDIQGGPNSGRGGLRPDFAFRVDLIRGEGPSAWISHSGWT
jgi:hypothetical protein